MAASLLLAVAVPLRFRELLGQDWSSVVLTARQGPEPPNLGDLWACDLRFVVWLIARNAYTFLHRPLRLFDAEPCYPTDGALALGEPGLTLGLLGIPAWSWTGEPLITYHTAVFASVWIGAFAMFLLVRSWTGNPVAALSAGLLYGLHPIKTTNIVHPYVVDTGWTVLAIYFTTRLFERGRARDGVASGLCIAAQIGGSLYPVVAGVVLALPLLVWLVLSRGSRRLSGRSLAPALLIPIATAAFVYSPYLALDASGAAAKIQVYMVWSRLLPGQSLFPGWILLFLSVVGIVLPLRTPASGPRWALLIGGALAAYLAAGGNVSHHIRAVVTGEPVVVSLPNVFAMLSQWIPGLDMVRVPASLHVALHLAIGALAGLGAAALLDRTPRRWTGTVSAILLVSAAIVALEPPIPGRTRRLAFAAVRLAPETDELELYRELDRRGSTGPIFDAPMAATALRAMSEAVLHSAYHHRRTSACYTSLRPERDALEHIGSGFSTPDGLRELARLGFSSVVVAHGTHNAKRVREHISRTSEGLLIEVARARQRTAWSISPEARRPPESPRAGSLPPPR